MYSPLAWTLLVAALLSCLSISVSARGQSGQSGQPAMHDQTVAAGEGKNVSLVGCLGVNFRGFEFAGKDGGLYQLVGATSGLSKYVGDVVQAEGTIDKSAKPLPALQVTSARFVSKVPAPRLSAAFRKAATWRAVVNRRYGLRFSHPADFTARSNSDVRDESSFPIQDGTVLLESFDFPDIYAGTNLKSGYFNLLVNPKITNRASCEQFGRSDPKYVTSSTMDSIHYTVFTQGSGAAGTFYRDRYFHTFQNGLCYEFGFDFGEVNTHNYDMWCTIPSLSEADEWNVIRPLLHGVSFARPKPPIARKAVNGAPEVISFTATPTVDSVTKLDETTLSWSTQNIDYVELSYDCPSGTVSVAFLDGSTALDCGNPVDKTIPLKRSPNGSVAVSFGNFHGNESVPVRVTMTPFHAAVPLGNLSKSLMVSVSPENPFPEGARTGTQNVTLSYLPDKAYRRGSSMTIQWTDVEKRDSCVNLYLVQDDEHGVAAYRSRFGEEKCQTPARSGSYTGQLPQKYWGPGFRIYAATPGGVSWALGQRFNIAR